MLSEQHIAEGWLPHNGGPCPVADDVHVAVMFKSGRSTSSAPADCFGWYDATAYKPEPKP